MNTERLTLFRDSGFVVQFCTLAVLASFPAFSGCGRSGPARYDLSGTVTYDGKPVFSGYLYFQPDKERGNDGPGTQIGFYEGRFQTAPGRGTIGGPHIVEITGFEEGSASDKPGPFGPDLKAPNHKLLFPPVRMKVDLPRQAGTYDFKVPKVPPAEK